MNSQHLWALIQASMTKQPDALALYANDQALTYAELERAVVSYKHYLIAQGVSSGDRIGLLLPRSSQMIVAILGTLSLGAVYVPLYHRYPVARNQSILDDSQCRYLISEQRYEHVQMLSPNPLRIEPVEPIPVVISPDDVAYIIYTSGSTGKPKGVMISHANVLSLIEWALIEFDQTTLSYTLASTAVCFDLSIFEMFVPLVAGGCVVLVENALALIDKCPNLPLSLINTVPSAARALLAHTAIPTTVNTINLAGEALEQELVDALYENTTVKRVYNLYGPSETTTYSTCYLCKKNANQTMVPIGKPILGTQIYLLDQHQLPTPHLAKGEIYIAGLGVTQGYCQRADETNQRYIMLNIGGTSLRVYRTGDLARLNHDQEYEYLGRIDQQIKIHGFRVELDEIIKTIQRHPDIAQAYVMSHPSANGTQELTGYLIANTEKPVTTDVLHQWLSHWLPDYMIPHHLMFLTELPLNTNGKIDRFALPLPHQNTEPTTLDYQTDLEHDIARFWQTLLIDVNLTRNTNFFYAGGHSLLAARLLAKLKSHYQITCHLEDIFQYPTIAGQAQLISERLNTQPLHPTIFFDETRPEHIPLSYGQERLWYLQYAEKSLPISNIPIVITIKGALHIQALESSLQHIIQRHEILRTVYQPYNQRVTQRICDKFTFKIAIEVLKDRSELPETLKKEANKPFDLSQDLMLRAKLIVWSSDNAMSPNESVLILTQHHIASDAWSLNILMHELSSLYNAIQREEALPLLPIPVQYADYSCWQRLQLNDKTFQTDLEYWQKKLAHAPDSIALPFDRKRGELQTYHGEFYQWELDQSLVEALKAVANTNQCTLFMVLLTAFDVLLHRYSQQTDFCIGILSANRPVNELSNSLGFFVNSLVTRHQVQATMTAQELLQQVKITVIEALAHQQLPFDKLVEALQPKRQLNRPPLFHVLFSLQNALDTDLILDGLTLAVNEFDRNIAKFDLTVSIVERHDKLVSIFEYNTDLFDRTTIEQMTHHYAHILTALSKNLSCTLGDMDMLSQRERKQLLVDLNQTEKTLSEHPNLVSHFESMATKYPNKTALISDVIVTYQELNHRANQLANWLAHLGVQISTPVGLLLPRGLDAIISMLAILKTGGYYVPMDPAWPTDRLDFVMSDAATTLVITRNISAANMPSSPMLFPINLDEVEEDIREQSSLFTPAATTANDACYIMYTSGSTGRPKGVIATHSGVMRLVKYTNYIALDPACRLLQVSPLAFDGSTFDIWGSLLNGATLALMPDGIPELNKLAEHLLDHQITTLFITTQLFNSLVEYKLPFLTTLTQVLFGGEVASIDHVERFKQRYPNCDLSNIYGPTECTTFALSYLIPNNFNRAQPLPLGRPITNTSAIILSENQKICPINVAGEIYLGGPGLAHGYLKQPELTQEKFVKNPFPELKTDRLYRTGDIGYYRQDGQIVFLGRVDNQVKIRGHRIELSEIEQALRETSDILDAVVLVQQPENYLVAYTITKSGLELNIKSVRQQLEHRMPHYMLPDAVQWMKQFPLNSNGKIDKQQLPRWDIRHQSKAADIDLSVNQEMAALIQQIWGDILENNQVTRQDNFFEVGGNSLKIILVLDSLQTHFQTNPAMLNKLDIVTLFQYPTIDSLAAYLQSGLPEATSSQQKKRINQRSKRKQASCIEEIL
jgi:amino acid adenylation domain-containing protein